MQPARIWYDGEWMRLLAPALMHASDMHLYYNMISLLWKVRPFGMMVLRKPVAPFGSVPGFHRARHFRVDPFLGFAHL